MGQNMMFCDGSIYLVPLLKSSIVKVQVGGGGRVTPGSPSVVVNENY